MYLKFKCQSIKPCICPCELNFTKKTHSDMENRPLTCQILFCFTLVPRMIQRQQTLPIFLQLFCRQLKGCKVNKRREVWKLSLNFSALTSVYGSSISAEILPSQSDSILQPCTKIKSLRIKLKGDEEQICVLHSYTQWEH